MAQRMAGEELEKNKTLGERFGQDYVDRVKEDGLQDGNKYSRKELASEFRYGRGDTSVDDTVEKYQGMVDSGEFKGNNKAQAFLEMHGVKFGGSGEDNEDIPVPETSDPDPVETSPVVGAPVEIDTGSGPVNIYKPPGAVGPGGQTVVQDNDQVSTVTGNGNTVTQNQDNSVSQNGFVSANSAKASGLKDSYILNLMNRKGY